MSDSTPPAADGTDELSTTREERVARLRNLLSGARSDTRWAQRLRANRSSNILIETALHAAARLSEGLVLSDLEQQLVDQMARIVSVEEVAEYGKLFKDAPGTAEFFPAGVERIPLERSYSLADYAADQEVLVRDALAQPNVNTIDLSSLPEGEPLDSLDSEEFIAAMGEHGSALTLVTAPRSAEETMPATFTLKPHKFMSVDGSDEIGADEFYWAAGAGSDEAARREYRSGVFGSMYTGNTRSFGGSDILFHGPVDRFCFIDIEAWEEDSGGIFHQISKYLYQVSDKALEAAERGQASGIPDDNAQAGAGALALFGFVTKFVGWLFSLFENKDDFVAHRSLGFTREALVALSKVPGGVGWPAGLAVYEFNGGKEGHLRLWIRTLAEPEPNHVALLTHSGSWSAPTLAWPGAKTPSAPALAFHAGDLYCAVRGVGDQIWVSRRQGSSWSTFAMVPGHLTRRPPALASFNGRLYLAHTAHNGQTVVTSSTNGKDWSAPVNLSGTTAHSPALAVHAGKLHYAACGGNGGIYLSTLAPGGTWSGFAGVPGSETEAAAVTLASHLGKLYVGSRNRTTDRVMITMHNGTAWERPYAINNGTTPDIPALASGGTTLYCAVRGGDRKIWLTRLTGAGWQTFVPITQAATTYSFPAIAARGTDDLAFAYRSTNL
ncbi:PLL family lectin [Streptomyces nigrescens]|uniref:hypothetical protein n=1 Tax=Streptomyces nigrescens TaxID=1920 RepID=UPI002257B03A|nr:hypothetical protein [Streptomyces libani]MCX5450235.1 hypothetical protein [Streptomyces libani]